MIKKNSMLSTKTATKKKYTLFTINLLTVHCSLLLVLCSLLFVNCFTAPKKPTDINVLRSQAETWLQMSNKEAELGKFTNALRIVTQAKNNAILADDSSLIIRVCLSRGNILFSLDRRDEAFTEWRQAVNESLKFKDAELISTSKIYLARGNLLVNKQIARSVLEEVDRESANIKKNRSYIAFSHQVRGLALRALDLYDEAEAAFKSSLDIHLKDRYLESAAYDWYIIASIRSLAKNPQGALQALEESIKVDRRIENSWGIAASYRAMGDIYANQGQQEEAAASYTRARTIYEAMKNDDAVADINLRMRDK